MSKRLSKGLFIASIICILTLMAGLTAAYADDGTGQIKGLSNKDGGITISWDADDSFEGYVIYRKAGSSDTWKTKATLPAGEKTSWTDTEVTNGTKYSYRVYPVLGGEEQSNTNSRTIYRLKTPKTSAVSKVPGAIQVSTDENTKVTGYKICYSRNSDFSSNSTKKVKTTDLSKALVNLSSGYTYYVKVRAYKVVGDNTYYSSYCPKIKVKTKGSCYGYVKGSTTKLYTKGGKKARTIRFHERFKVLKAVKKSNGKYRYKVKYHGNIYYIWSSHFTTKNLQNYSSSSSKRQKAIKNILTVFNRATDYKSNRHGSYNSRGQQQFDCSGFAGYILKKTTGHEYGYGLVKLYHKGKTVCKGSWNSSKVRPGDLVFFNNRHDGSYGKKPVTHVGVYLGHGQFAHCSSYYGKVVISKMDGMYKKNFKKAKSYL